MNVSSWRITTIFLVLLSSVIFLIQRTSWAIFETVFEICIFHIPTLVSAAIYLKLQGSQDTA
ncbi:MAG: hypothetical protein JSV18_06500 [Candidatus Bathyarchaeota archaeon]|nr:MAG: hypothetical protein JSV18_06500 [Candidatus Bathyarchaeota archaeon]